MPRAEVGTPKYLANAMKSKGLQRLRWYCQVCEKQCRDENGFKCHIATESHLRQMLVVGESAGRHINDYSSQFQAEFVALWSRRYGTKRVLANNVYQQYIQDKHHVHMNATRWVTLTEFVKHLGRTGQGRVDETEKGWFIAWVDNSPKALAKAEASAKKDKATMSDEQRERELLKNQIEKAQREAEALGTTTSGGDGPGPSSEGLKRDEGERLVLSFGKKPSPPITESGPSTSPQVEHSTSSAGPSAPVGPAETTPGPSAPLKINALKPAGNPSKKNVFKLASKPAPSSSIGSGTSAKRDSSQMSAGERLMLEDMERKKRKIVM